MIMTVYNTQKLAKEKLRIKDFSSSFALKEKIRAMMVERQSEHWDLCSMKSAGEYLALTFCKWVIIDTRLGFVIESRSLFPPPQRGGFAGFQRKRLFFSKYLKCSIRCYRFDSRRPSPLTILPPFRHSNRPKLAKPEIPIKKYEINFKYQ